MNNKDKLRKLAEIEKDKSFKYSQVPFSYKWKSWLYLGPVLLLFMSLFCIIYLLNTGMLVSWYVAPYIVIFIIATIWFKAVRKYILKKMVEDPERLLLAYSKPVLVDEYKVYALLSTGANRHNMQFIEHQSKTVNSIFADLIPALKPGKALPLPLDTGDGADELYLFCLRKFTVKKKIPQWNQEDVFPVVLINKKQVKILPL